MTKRAGNQLSAKPVKHITKIFQEMVELNDKELNQLFQSLAEWEAALQGTSISKSYPRKPHALHTDLKIENEIDYD